MTKKSKKNEILHRAVRVETFGDHAILVQFDDGKKKAYNCYPLMEQKMFSKLRDKDFFRTVRIDEMGLVCWDDATDINPHELYNNSTELVPYEID